MLWSWLFCLSSDRFVLICFNYETFISWENDVDWLTVRKGTIYCMQPNNLYYFVTGVMWSEDLV